MDIFVLLALPVSTAAQKRGWVPPQGKTHLLGGGQAILCST